MAEPRVIWVDSATKTASTRVVDELPSLVDDQSGWLWLDLPEPDFANGFWLKDVFGVSQTVVQDILERNHVPRLYAYTKDLLFLVLHKPEPGALGHVHYLELDQLISRRFLITTHGPRSEKVPLDRMLVETDAVAERLLSGKLVVESPVELSHRIVSRLCQAEERYVNNLARDVGLLEQRVMAHQGGREPSQFLESLFETRHALLTVHTMTSQSSEIYGRAIRLYSHASDDFRKSLRDLKDQYERLARISHAQLEFLGGVTEYYRALTDTRMTIAGERLAVIAAITLPVTAVSGILGMNTIVNAETEWVATAILLAVMATISGLLLRWARRMGWW